MGTSRARRLGCSLSQPSWSPQVDATKTLVLLEEWPHAMWSISCFYQDWLLLQFYQFLPHDDCADVIISMRGILFRFVAGLILVWCREFWGLLIGFKSFQSFWVGIVIVLRFLPFYHLYWPQTTPNPTALCSTLSNLSAKNVKQNTNQDSLLGYDLRTASPDFFPDNAGGNAEQTK